MLKVKYLNLTWETDNRMARTTREIKRLEGWKACGFVRNKPLDKAYAIMYKACYIRWPRGWGNGYTWTKMPSLLKEDDHETD